jgi:cobalt/nickel transport system permease protein
MLSFKRWELERTVPFIFFPCIFAALAELQALPVLRRSAIALPFCLFAGISNLIFERSTAFFIGSLPITFGLLSCTTMLLRALLCSALVVILSATTPMQELSAQLRRFRVPAVFVGLLELCYRYTSVLLAEAQSMYSAYTLRHGADAIDLKDMGTFVGHLFLRAADRAERVYAAMQCRGYSIKGAKPALRRMALSDVGFLCAVCAVCIVLRLVSLPLLIGSLLYG